VAETVSRCCSLRGWKAPSVMYSKWQMASKPGSERLAFDAARGAGRGVGRFRDVVDVRIVGGVAGRVVNSVSVAACRPLLNR